jgi:hypothetical protein
VFEDVLEQVAREFGFVDVVVGLALAVVIQRGARSRTEYRRIGLAAVRCIVVAKDVDALDQAAVSLRDRIGAAART